MREKILLMCCLCFFISANAQETLTRLTQNVQLVKESKKGNTKNQLKSIKLPFIDDFSNYIGYPDTNLWIDKQGFVNNSYPIFPPTIGVVTLDALNEYGQIYPHATPSPFDADTLTSQPIRLDTNFNTSTPIRIQDSLYFSFYYQPGGGCFAYPQVEWERIGDQPELDDLLILEFGYATGENIFLGYEYSPYEIGEDEYFVVGDSIINPFIPGTYYIFEANAFPGEIILIPSDSIIGPQYVWNTVWSSEGTSLNNWLNEDSLHLNYFKQVLIPITDAQYLRNNFQFRFHNMASLEHADVVGWASNVDQWHIDYIRLNINRSYDDYYPSDVAFVAPTTSILNKYQAMPWNQFRPDVDLITQFSNQLSNLSTITKNTNYSYNIYKNGTTSVGDFTSNNENATPYYPNGLHTYQNHAFPSFNANINYDGEDSSFYKVVHLFQTVGGTGDMRHANDSCIYIQKFYNYYAYDDGTAEAGYTILSTLNDPETYLAMRFDLAEPDTLRCVRIWFNAALNDENFDYFTLMVWDDNNNEPGNLLCSLPAQLPSHNINYLNFSNYYLDEPLPISGSFWVGFYQNHDTQLNIGFDQNTDSRDFFRYKIGNEWREPFLKGTPMIRPVLGKQFDHSSITSLPEIKLNLYPNPTSNLVHLQIEPFNNENMSFQLFDIYGKLLQINTIHQNESVIDLSAYAHGLYLLKIYSDNNPINTLKIIKQ